MTDRARVCTPDPETPEPLEGSYFVSTYPPFSRWTAAAADTWRRHLDTPQGENAAPLGLYVHIPFCVDRCHYCYYLSHDDRLDALDRYLSALDAELSRYARTPALSGRELDFVYFGGGTPSLLSTARVDRLMTSLQSAMPWSAAREVSFECAPRSVHGRKLQTLRDRGVTRISLGVQQLNDEVLRANGRVHLVADVEAAYRAIRDVGFPVVNVDLIVGLVAESDATFDASLERIVDMAPDTVTIYQLEIPLNTPLWRSLQARESSPDLASWDTKRERLARGFDRLEAAGYEQVSAYTAARDPERHRFLYQTEQYRGADLLGIGASAFSHLHGVNQQNLAGLSEYLGAVEAGRLPLLRSYALSADERAIRELVLQLKLGRVETAYFRDKFDIDVTERFAAPIADLAQRGWLRVDDHGVTVTRPGLLRVDRMLERFYPPEHRGVRYS